MYKRITAIFAVIVFGFSFLGARLAYLNLGKDEMLAEAALRQQNSVITIAQKKGDLYDRQGNSLRGNEKKRVALILPALCDDRESLYQLLRAAGEKTENLYDKVKGDRPFICSGEGLEQNLYTRIFEVETDGAYPFAQHVIGHRDKDEIGRSGLLYAFEPTLSKQQTSIRYIVGVDAARRQLTGLAGEVDYADYDKKGGVKLTLSTEIQNIAEKAAADLSFGAVVVSEVKTGEILAMVSKPSYQEDRMADYLNSSEGELMNHALQSYNIGSIFKLVVLAAYTEKEGKLPDLKVTCTGSVKVGDRIVHCHKEEGHGEVDVTGAVAGSCNIYFIELAKQIGLSRILDVAERLGIGERRTLATGISSAAGSLPKRQRNPLPGVLANTAIGQGSVMMTPLDVVYLMDTIANGGKTNSLSLVKGIYDQGAFQPMPKTETKYIFSAKTAELLQQVMNATVEEGTGKSAKPEVGGAGGKTATAETGMKKNGVLVTQGWFAGYYPADKPEYAIVILAEGASSGGGSAGPIFRDIANGIAKYQGLLQ